MVSKSNWICLGAGWRDAKVRGEAVLSLELAAEGWVLSAGEYRLERDIKARLVTECW